MSILAIIPARSGSVRLKNKNLKNFCGKPLLQWTVEQACRIKEIDEIVVTSDIRRIQFDGMSPLGTERLRTLGRDDSLAQHDTPMAQVICDVLAQSKWPSLVVLLQPTSPTRADEEIRKCIDGVREGLGVVAQTVASIPGTPPNGAVYVFPPEHLPPFYSIEGGAYERLSPAIDINTLEEFERAEAVMRERFK